MILVEERFAGHCLQIEDGLLYAQRDVFERGFSCRGRLPGSDKAVLTFDHVEIHRSRGGRAYIYSQKRSVLK